MGLLDQREASDWDLPNFDSSFSPTRSSIEDDSKQNNQHEETTAKRVDSTATSNTNPSPKSSMTQTTRPKIKHSATTAHSSSQTSPTAPQREPQPKPRRATLPATNPQGRGRRRSSAKVFDLYGEDAALQDAIPRIHFCDVCFRACDIH